ncbi:hypothetical protein ACHAW5_005250 [Stephanodiscus triporus]|uniref:Protochlorophyllide reductase n=1 Tax=Stephanodiscus triporus TaxID=2934178 RepID=A0ABD3MTF3_9STRA
MMAARVVVAVAFAWASSSSSSTRAECYYYQYILVATSMSISVAFVLRTRRIEVDGPMPPIGASDSRRLDGVVVFVTGANAGIGLETSRQLYHRGATVVLGCRSRTRAREAMRVIDPDHHHHDDDDDDKKTCAKSHEKETSRRGGGGRLHFVEVDLTSLASVREASRAYLDAGMPLHVLINNAGVMRKRREETSDGIEMTMAANHFGHFLLTDLLLPRLRESAEACGRPSRVITVSSSLYLNAARIDLSDMQCERKRYSLFEQYAQSKLANVMFAIELGRRERMRWQGQQKQQKKKQPRQPSHGAIPKEGGKCNSCANEVTIPTKKNEKKTLRPKLTPVDDLPMDDDEVGLGYSDIVPTPPPAMKKTIAEVTKDDHKGATEGESESKVGIPTLPPTKKKKARPKLIPVSSNLSSYEDEMGLGFDDVVISASLSPTEKKDEVHLANTTPVQSTAAEEDEGRGEQEHNSTTTKTATINDAEESRTLSLPPVMSYCLHPGLVRTNFVRDMPWYLYYPNKLFAIFMAPLQKTPRSGAYTSVFCAVMDAREIYNDECYFVNSELQTIARSALDEEDCKKLWELSSELVSSNNVRECCKD